MVAYIASQTLIHTEIIPMRTMTKKSPFLLQPADDPGATYCRTKRSPLTHQKGNMPCSSRSKTLTHITSQALCRAPKKAKHQLREKGHPQQLTFGPALGSVRRAAHRRVTLHQQPRKKPPHLVPKEPNQPGEAPEAEEEEHEAKEGSLQAATRTLTSAEWTMNYTTRKWFVKYAVLQDTLIHTRYLITLIHVPYNITFKTRYHKTNYSCTTSY